MIINFVRQFVNKHDRQESSSPLQPLSHWARVEPKASTFHIGRTAGSVNGQCL